MRNPFKFGREVSGYQFYDRKKITRELRQKMVDGSSNVVLFAPRRYGKTSLVVRVLEELAVKDCIKGLCFDMTRVTNLGRFCEAYVNAVYAMAGGRKELMHKLTDYLASFRPELTVTVAGVVRIHLDVAAALERGKRVVTTDGAPAWGEGELFDCSDCSDCSIGYGGRLVYLKGFRDGTDEERVRMLKEALEELRSRS